MRTNIASGPIVQTDYGYTGQRNLDDDIGLMDYKARFYSPVLNRFIQPDTVVKDPTNPIDWNRYTYTRNNPIRYSDPTGHVPCEPGARCPVPIGDRRDLTDWIVAAAVDIAESPEMQEIANLNNISKYGVIGGPITVGGAKALAFSKFKTLVEDGAVYDVKDNILKDIGYDTKIGNNWYEYSTAGNIIYGFYGKAAGFSEFELRLGAGYAQRADYKRDGEEAGIGPCGYPYYCDTEVDYYAVGFGMYLYDKYYEDDKKLTEADLLDALENYEYTDNMDLLSPPNNFMPRHYNYPANKFYNKNIAY